MRTVPKSDAALLRGIMNEPGWDVLQRLLREQIEQIASEVIVGTTGFETLRMLHQNQGARMALLQFFEDLDRGAFD